MGTGVTVSLARAAFGRIAHRYARRWCSGLCLVRTDGTVIWSHSASGWAGAAHRRVRAQAVQESLRWGEPAVQQTDGEAVIWGVPLMRNAKVTGGLVAGIEERLLFRKGTTEPSIDVRAACTELRLIAEQHNLTNAALLESRRMVYEREQSRAMAIHAYKTIPLYDIRALYLVEEPALVSAIRNGDHRMARGILNRLLVPMMHRAGGKADVIRSFFMELIATMSRTAVEAGGSAEEWLGGSFDRLAQLSKLTDEEQLAAWLHDMLERIMSSIRAGHRPSAGMLVSHALRLMGEHCRDDISREWVAERLDVSPSHFSRLFARHVGKPFKQVLVQMRLEHAAEMLAQSQTPPKLVASQCGFADQSHLTKAFRGRYGTTPALYRKEHENTKV